MLDPSGHIPVLEAPILQLLDPHPGEVALDCTLGRSGHALSLARRIGSGGTFVGIDLDPSNVAFARQRLGEVSAAVELHQGSFVEAPVLLRGRGLAAHVLLADLGFASTQVDDPSRGLSFSADGPLDMRFDPQRGASAAELVARLGERELSEMLRMLGEEPLGPRIARAIVQHRRRAPIRTTMELAEIVRSAYGARARQSRLHPATRTFMALRIAVNDELNALAALLGQIERAGEDLRSGRSAWLAPGARVGIISFHSLEDRLVKQAFARLEEGGLAERLVRRPVVADEAELLVNPRARSAKLRVVRMAGGAAERGDMLQVRS